MVKILLVLGIFFNGVSSESGMSGKIVGVADGNTVEVTTDANAHFRIALLGIDCPELGQDFGVEAKEFVEKRLLGKDVTIKIHGKDRSGDYVGIVLLNDGIDIRLDLLKHGLAWTTEKNPIAELEILRLQAVTTREGLWRSENPTPPWIYRRQQSMAAPKSQ
ncbi:MAG: thermonuclease family protein [Chryseosolibacter sp.]